MALAVQPSPCDEFQSRFPPEPQEGTQPEWRLWENLVEIFPGKISSRSSHRRVAPRLHPPPCRENQLGISPDGVCYLACGTVRPFQYVLSMPALGCVAVQLPRCQGAVTL